VSFAFDGDPANVSRDQLELGGPAAAAYPAEPSEVRARPGLAIASDRARTAANGTPHAGSAGIQAAPRPAGEGRELPFLTVLQSTRAETVAPPVSEARPAPAPRGSAPAREQLAATVVPPRAPDPVCVVGCDPAEAREPTEGLVSAAAPDVVADQALVGEAAEARVAQGGLPSGEGLIEPAPGAVHADALASGAPLADAGPMRSAEPSGELIAAESSASILETPAAEVGAGAPDPAAEPERAAIALSDPATDRGAVAGVAESSPASTIPHHLARIGERYSATAPTAQPAAVAPADPASPPPAGETAVAVDIGQTDSSSVIVQDDELVAIRLGELVSLLEHRFDHPLYVWIKSSGAASKFVTGETLAAAGITTRYDAEKDQIVLSTTGD
jgi:hypothetical protein